jgi:hypothetical protein
MIRKGCNLLSEAAKSGVLEKLTDAHYFVN